MKILVIISVILLSTACHQDKIKEIEMEITAINQLTDTLHHVEIEDDWNTGRIEATRIMYLIDNDSLIRRISSNLRLGTYDLDTLHELDYYYRGDNVIYMSIRETINTPNDTSVLHDCDYYFDDQELFSNNCQKGEPKESEDLVTAARFNLTAVEQLMKN